MTAPFNGHALLDPISADHPCGENLEGSQLLASFDAFRLFGHETASPEARPDPRDSSRLLPAPDWNEMKQQALDGLSRSKDLRLLVRLGTASLRTDGLPAFTETLTVASQWLDTYWADTFPRIEEDDPISRRSALNCFADPMAVVECLKRVPVVSSRHGRYSLADIEDATRNLNDDDAHVQLDRGPIKAAFAEMPVEDLAALQRSAADALAASQRLTAAMSSRAGTDAAPDLAPLSLPLARMNLVLKAQVALRTGGAVTVSGSGSESVSGNGGPVRIGAIGSRQDAIRAMDAVAEFFRRTEPSSPVPMFLDRAKRLVSKDFLEVLADIAPEAVPHAKAVGGLGAGG